MTPAANDPRRRPLAAALVLALALGIALLQGCGGASNAASRPGATGTNRALAAPTLDWHQGQGVDVDAQIQQMDLASTSDRAVPTSVSVRSRQSLQVTAVQGGSATLRVETPNWTWLENRSELIPGSPPGPFQVQVDPQGVLESGEYWSLPNHPRPPGIDLVSAGLPDRHVQQGDRWTARWQRTKRDDLPLTYQVSSVASQATADSLTVDSHLDWDVSQIANTSSGDLERLQGTGHGDSRSQFDTVRGRLKATSYRVTYDTTDAAGGASVHTQGTIRSQLTFRYR